MRGFSLICAAVIGLAAAPAFATAILPVKPHAISNHRCSMVINYERVNDRSCAFNTNGPNFVIFSDKNGCTIAGIPRHGKFVYELGEYRDTCPAVPESKQGEMIQLGEAKRVGNCIRNQIFEICLL
jgi:hypothetical protein